MILWELENSSYIPDFFRFAYFAYIQNLKDQLGHFSIFWWIFWYILIGWFWVYFELLKLENRTFFIFSVPHLELNLMILACCTLAMCSKTTNDLDLKLQTCINESLVKIWKKMGARGLPIQFCSLQLFFHVEIEVIIYGFHKNLLINLFILSTIFGVLSSVNHGT